MKEKYMKRLEKLDKDLDDDFIELKEVCKKILFKGMIYRDLHHEGVVDLLENSLTDEMRKKLK
jgi:hypothetical protein